MNQAALRGGFFVERGDMAQDDMFVVMYEILAYLYDCLKKGAEPKRSMLAHDGDMLAINYPYWARIMKELLGHGFIDGVVIQDTYNNGPVVVFDDPVITMEGVEFLQENSKMQKALKYLKEVKSALPFI